MRRRETVARLATLGGVAVLAWVLWALTSDGGDGLPWAVWPTLALLIVAALELRRVYLSGSDTDSGARR
jgi:hypothetical protein